VFAGLASQVGHPYPGLFFATDYRVFPVEPAACAVLRYGDRIVAVDGRPDVAPGALSR